MIFEVSSCAPPDPLGRSWWGGSSLPPHEEPHSPLSGRSFVPLPERDKIIKFRSPANKFWLTPLGNLVTWRSRRCSCVNTAGTKSQSFVRRVPNIVSQVTCLHNSLALTSRRMKNVSACKAIFRTTSPPDREYLHNETRYRWTETALQTAISPAHAHLIWWTLVHKQRKQDRSFDRPHSSRIRFYVFLKIQKTRLFTFFWSDFQKNVKKT